VTPKGFKIMKRTSILRFGAISAFLCGALYLLVGVTHFLLPHEQLRGATGVDAAFFESLASSSAVFTVHYWLVVLACLFAVGVILAFLQLLHGHQSGFLCWAALLGLLGAGLAAIDYAYVGVEGPRLAQRFVASSSAAQSALLLQGVPHVDPCFLAWGLMGLWALAANTAALQARRLPRFLGWLGILGGSMLLLTFAGALGRSALLVDISVGLAGIVVGPAWNFWFGGALRRAVAEENGSSR
jgi:hypothetical protein